MFVNLSVPKPLRRQFCLSGPVKPGAATRQLPKSSRSHVSAITSASFIQKKVEQKVARNQRCYWFVEVPSTPRVGAKQRTGEGGAGGPSQAAAVIPRAAVMDSFNLRFRTLLLLATDVTVGKVLSLASVFPHEAASCERQAVLAAGQVKSPLGLTFLHPKEGCGITGLTRRQRRRRSRSSHRRRRWLRVKRRGGTPTCPAYALRGPSLA
jgi:hypothetical protein